MIELSKEQWYPIVYNVLMDYKDEFDTLTIQAAFSDTKKGIPIWRVNYKTTRGDWSTGFGCIEVKKDEVIKLLRDSKIRRILV